MWRRVVWRSGYRFPEKVDSFVMVKVVGKLQCLTAKFYRAGMIQGRDGRRVVSPRRNSPEAENEGQAGREDYRAASHQDYDSRCCLWPILSSHRRVTV